MSFFGSVSKAWKKAKHKVDSVASPSHIALNAALGKKKGQAIGDSVDVAVGSAYTFGLGKVAASAGQAAEAKDKLKKQKKAAKKAAKLALKKGLPVADDSALTVTSGFVSTPTKAQKFKSVAGTVPTGYVYGPKTDRNLTLAGAGLELAGQFVDDGSAWSRALNAGQGLIGGLAGGEDAGDGFGPMPDYGAGEPQAEASSAVPPWLMVAGAAAVLLLVVRS